MVNSKRASTRCFGALIGALLTSALALAQGTEMRGQTIRVTAQAKLNVPDVISVDADGTIHYKGRYSGDQSSGLVAVEIEGRTLHIPLPRTRVTGRLVATEEGTITLSRDEEPNRIVIPREAIGKIEVRRRSRGATAALLGTAILSGAALGFAACYSHEKDLEDSRWWSWPGLTGAMCTLPGAAVGVVLFTVAGGDGWKPISGEKLRVVIAPGRGGASASITVAF